MFMCGFSPIKVLCRAGCTFNIVSKKCNILPKFVRGNKTITASSPSTKPYIFPCLSNLVLNYENIKEIQFPKYLNEYTRLNLSLLNLENITTNNMKFLRKTNDKGFKIDCLQKEVPGIAENTYWMGSLLKKRRRKMNCQKYKKRRKRDRFKREALKYLRERKRQRKERAAERKQTILSNMVVNKSISKRRARYLSHKLLPGVIKGQGLG
ncbi:uncharacterized protein LOC114517987 [Dendronephthya gigantea]|uniref:uncharacterized protein LOC114517987 n=1 Tax=Dendronephthya gigantea TaxID=151771 RepID=UPI0010695F9D|nr:uncharacterized protein LOC114517987 [Dendronephthya gigantea]